MRAFVDRPITYEDHAALPTLVGKSDAAAMVAYRFKRIHIFVTGHAHRSDGTVVCRLDF